MSARAWICLVVIWLTSLVSVGVLAQTLQKQHDEVYSGANIGFRVDQRQNGVPVGTLMVRIDGRWTPVRFGVHVERSGARSEK